MITYYKVTGSNATSCHGGTLQWSKPRGERPGQWLSVAGPVKLCHKGFHAVTAEHVLDWGGTEVWEIELAGERRTDGAKIVAQRARLIRLAMGAEALRHFAVACSARVLPIYEAAYPDDLRVRDCLVSCGPGATSEQISAASRSAESAAWSAESAACSSASAAARSAESAACSSARISASYAENAAARSAARIAAASAAWRSAARIAARAERSAQLRLLCRYLTGEVDLSRPVKLPPRPKSTP